jgi:hypothetical protein
MSLQQLIRVYRENRAVVSERFTALFSVFGIRGVFGILASSPVIHRVAHNGHLL